MAKAAPRKAKVAKGAVSLASIDAKLDRAMGSMVTRKEFQEMREEVSEIKYMTRSLVSSVEHL